MSKNSESTSKAIKSISEDSILPIISCVNIFDRNDLNPASIDTKMQKSKDTKEHKNTSRNSEIKSPKMMPDSKESGKPSSNIRLFDIFCGLHLNEPHKEKKQSTIKKRAMKKYEISLENKSKVDKTDFNAKIREGFESEGSSEKSESQSDKDVTSSLSQSTSNSFDSDMVDSLDPESEKILRRSSSSKNLDSISGSKSKASSLSSDSVFTPSCRSLEPIMIDNLDFESQRKSKRLSSRTDQVIVKSSSSKRRILHRLSKEGADDPLWEPPPQSMTSKRTRKRKNSYGVNKSKSRTRKCSMIIRSKLCNLLNIRPQKR
ncbi:hypothetical protein O3M35_009731 [Rhynocoris fuscipes]|uniref:Uncharacterized protein n=1 Tax=Rhynocoris fuscipes TaxID=488301 RepID=A0AAW1D6B6_9HEMI